ncbi:hypothetical protein SESBI_48117 [Sesbania bispinosa]|nr:hypothetical protein SESBI_48117 [Sesbania bispinosa]
MNENNGFFGFPAGPLSSSSLPPPSLAGPYSSQRASTWDFLNFFNTYDNNGYPSYRYYESKSSMSSPNSKKVREREGIPELEDETKQEMVKEVSHEKKKKKWERKR